MSTKYSATYRNNDVTTANRVKLVVMLHDGAIRFLKESKKRIETNDVGGRSIYISKAVRIVTELQCTLNMKEGGEIAERLNELYSFMMRHLTKANLTGDAKPIDDTVKILENLRDGWTQLMKAPENQDGPEIAAPQYRQVAIHL